MTVLDNIMLGRHVRMKSGVLSSFVYWGLAQKEEIAHRERCEELIDFLELQDLRKQPTSALAYGLRKRVELARALALEPKLLLLDEPMGGMNQEEKEDMARYIIDVNEQWGTTIILIEHDMAVVMDISDHVTVLDRGRKHRRRHAGRGAAQPGGDPGLSRRRRAPGAGGMSGQAATWRAIESGITLPQLLRRNAEQHAGPAGAAREGPRHLADLQLAALLRRGAGISRWGWRRTASGAATSCR